jgi:hypothetical protein
LIVEANARHARALNSMTVPSRSLVSRTRTARAVSATSTQSPPLLPLRVDLPLGEEVFRASGIERSDDSEALRVRVGQLEQQVLDLRQELEERTDDLDAARAANRDLMTLANRNTAGPS